MKRFNLFINGNFASSASIQYVSAKYDLRTLIPHTLNDKTFRIRASFNLASCTGTPAGGLEIGLRMPSSYSDKCVGINSTDPYVRLGVATPLAVSSSYSYRLVESDCFEIQVPYPMLTQLDFIIDPIDVISLPSGTYYAINLSFELVD